METDNVRITPSEKTKLYLTKKLSEIEIKLRRMKKKKIIIQTIGSILIIGSMSSSVLIASLVFPADSSDVTICYVSYNEWSFD